MEFTVPLWAVCPLINGDPIEFGTEEQNNEDEQKINNFIAHCIEEYGQAMFMLGEKSYTEEFRTSNDIDNLGSECTTLYLFNQKS